MFADHPLLKPFLNLEPDTFPEEAIRQVIAHQQDMTPLLLAVLRDFADYPEDYNEQEGNCLHLVALMVLAQFRECAAFPVLADIVNDFDQDQDQDEEDWDYGAAYDSLLFSIGENGIERITASIMVNDIAQLKGVILDRSHGLELRVLALETMKCFYFEGDISRSELIDFYSSLFRAFKSEHQEDDFRPLWLTLYDECMTIHPQELMEDIREACEFGFLGEEYDRSFVKAGDYCIESPEQWWQSNREQLLTEFGYIRHADRELESWGMNQGIEFVDWLGGLDFMDFSTAKLTEKVRQRADPNEQIANAYGEIFHESSSTPFVREDSRVGRNDPCPCNSGKKFKKCCGR